jgi:hypothetical protein
MTDPSCAALLQVEIRSSNALVMTVQQAKVGQVCRYGTQTAVVFARQLNTPYRNTSQHNTTFYDTRMAVHGNTRS